MKVGKKYVNLDEIEVYNTEMIHTRVMCPLSMGRIELEDVLKYEISPIPLTLFENNGEMRDSKAKSSLKSALQVETSCRLQPKADAIIVGGCAQFWYVSWPTKGTVETLANTFYQHIVSYLMKDIDVYLVFDRYCKYSVKGQTRKRRTGNISNHHSFSMNTLLPSKEVTLISPANKVQLIDHISRYITEKLRCVTFPGRFVVTFSDPTSVHVEGDMATTRTDLRSTYEEADVNIIRQCLSCIEDGA